MNCVFKKKRKKERKTGKTKPQKYKLVIVFLLCRRDGRLTSDAYWGLQSVRRPKDSSVQNSPLIIYPSF